MTSEKILVVKTDLLNDIILNNDSNLIFTEKEKIFDLVLNNFLFLERAIAEPDPSYRQIIPYLILHHQKNYFLLQRTKKQTEKRLHNKYSLGIGGHINPSISSEYENIIIEGLYKELNEEIQINDQFEMKYIGIINDITTNVGTVHLGLAYQIELSTPDVRILESDKMTGEWASVEELKKQYEYFESWSQIIFKQFILKEKRTDKDKGED